MKRERTVVAPIAWPTDREPGDTFTWDPRATQIFTPEDSAHNDQLVGSAASFNKVKNYGFNATGAVRIVANDGGTTTWGVVDGPTGPWPNTIFEVSEPEGQILFTSSGRLVIGSDVQFASTLLVISHGIEDATHPDPNGERTGMGLDVPDVEFTGAEVDISNKSAFHMGTGAFNVSTVTLNDAAIWVRTGSVCRITPNLGPRRIAVRGLTGVRIDEDSSAYLGGDSWDFSRDSVAFFQLDGVTRGTSGPSVRSYCYLSGFDFLSDTYYPPGLFIFSTKDDNGSTVKNNGEFVFAGIGDAFQLSAMLDKQLITIGGLPADSRDIVDDFTGGDLRIRLK